ncbi:hypothetical protein V3Q90_02505 [Flavobacterium oreochromis]|uniref:hypothetical protein n=1 Tax=Flavobacterium oreochromis TaxID=2906078 RepID=UPI00385A0EE5
MAIVGVECNADRYFFGRLLENKNLIRKERNDTEVIKSVVERSKGNFSIGIVDVDKNKKLPTSFTKINENDWTYIYKHQTNCQFLILVGPRQFEHWINEYLRQKEVLIESFGFVTFNDFMETSKSTKPETSEKFKNVIDYVFSTYIDEENHILKLKRQLDYILEKKYQFNIDEFLDI